MGDGYRRSNLWIYDLFTKKYICEEDEDFTFPSTNRLVAIALDPTDELVESESLNKFLDSFRIKE